MGRGKVGDVVFSRLNGQQVARVRNRNPKNPRTNAQLYQRAIMATVMQAYSAGMIIFDHSFEGKEVGAANQRRFMSLNAKLLRSQIAADIEGQVAAVSQKGRVVAPGVSAPVAALLQVSEGSLVNTILNGTVPAAESGEKVGAYCARMGIVANDIFTLVAFAANTSSSPLFTLDGDNTAYSKQFPTQFLFARYKVKASALTNTTDAITNLGQILELSDSNVANAPELTSASVGDVAPTGVLLAVGSKGTSCWIRSRENEIYRSTAKLDSYNNEAGIISSFALAAWTQGTAALGNSDLILEGGDI